MSKIAIVGGGIAGLTCAHLLHPRHSIELYEARGTVGGHANTRTVEIDGGQVDVDTGFIVFNERAYPRFIRLLESLGVQWQDAPMTFSVSCRRTGVEYGGASLSALFAQRRNLLRPGFLRMVWDVLRFGRESAELLEPGGGDPDLVEYVQGRGYSRRFIELYLVPMASAIWSAEPDAIARMPARTFVQFFANHGILDIRDAPQWLTIRGGSARYVERLIAPFRDRVRASAAVRRVVRRDDGWLLALDCGESGPFDDVIIATHSDQALSLLERPTTAQREVLAAISYQSNTAVLHTDARLMPRRRRAWASWNYIVPPRAEAAALVTYNLSILQSISSSRPLLVSLNCDSSVDSDSVLHRETYEHPVLDRDAVAAQARYGEISGSDGLHFCGAYWGYGFHEDGVESAYTACRGLGVEP